jgi:hypothetical protein
MSLEEILVDGDVLDSHNALLWFHFFNGVHQKERVAMWQDLLDPYTVEDHRLWASACYGLRVARLVRCIARALSAHCVGNLSRAARLQFLRALRG